MRLTLLGCGTSSGVPRIGGDWGACDPAEPRNRRRRASALVEHGGTSVLIDTGPDMRDQLIDAGVTSLDAVIWTHDHADHVHGIDDLRQVSHLRGGPVPAYARADTLAAIRARFGYVFEGLDGYPPVVDPRPLPDDVMIGDIRIRTVDQPHGSISSAGLRFDADRTSIGYSTDYNIFTDDMATLFEGVDAWVADALRERPHPTHPHLSATLEHIARVRPGLAVLTHMDQSMDYRSLCDTLPPGVAPGHDAMVIAP